MTVESYLKSKVMGLDLTQDVLQAAVESPAEVGLEPLSLEEIRELGDEYYQERLDYAVSTLYYSVLGVFAGGGYTEQVGDVRMSRSGFTVTASDRERYKMLADGLRKKYGYDVEPDPTEDNGLFDAEYLRWT